MSSPNGGIFLSSAMGKSGKTWTWMIHHASSCFRLASLAWPWNRPNVPSSSNYSSQCPRNPNPHRRILKAKKDLGVTAPASLSLSSFKKIQTGRIYSNLFSWDGIHWDPLRSSPPTSLARAWRRCSPPRAKSQLLFVMLF